MQAVRIGLAVISAAVVLVWGPPARAGMDDALGNCNQSRDAVLQLAGCDEIIGKYLSRFSRKDKAIAYGRRADAKIALDYDDDAIITDFDRSCDLGSGRSCCKLALWYFDEWQWEVDDFDRSKRLRAQVEAYSQKAESLGFGQEKCEKLY